MAILCCCGRLCPKKKHAAHPEDKPARGRDPATDTIIAPEILPTRPPPARLPSLVSDLNVHHPLPSPRSTAAPSFLTNPLPGISDAVADVSIQLGELVIENSEGDDDGEGEDDGDGPLVHSSENRSTSTLEAVKARIRRHLSQDSMSRKSETEEQIARRAEVKRLMRKRIQEELRSEAHGRTRKTSMPLDVATTSVLTLSNGPRDTIEFAVDQTNVDKDLVQAMARSLDDCDHRMSKATSQRSSTQAVGKENHHTNSRPTSLHDFAEDPDVADPHMAHCKHLRQRSSLPHVLASPILHPVNSSRFNDASSIASWRLSLSADKLADLLTPDKTLSMFRPVASPAVSTSTVSELDRSIRRLRSTSSPLAARNSNVASRARASQASLNSGFRRRLTTSHSLVRDESPVGLWLRTQGQQFHVTAASRPQSYADLDAAIIDKPADSPHDRPCMYRAAQEHVTQFQQANDQQHSEPSRASDSGDQKNGTPLRTRSCQSQTEVETARNSMVCDLDPHADSQNHLSSLSPARPPAPTPGQSPGITLNVPAADVSPSVQDTVRRGFSRLRLPSLRWRYAPSKGQRGLASGPHPDSDPGISTTILHICDTRQTTIELGSEKSSYLRHEAALRNVDEHCPDSEHRKEPSIATESKFQEVFHDGLRSAAKTSLLCKLPTPVLKNTRAVLKNLDGNDSKQGLTAHPTEYTSEMQQVINPISADYGHLKAASVDLGFSSSRSPGKSSRPSTRCNVSPRTRGFSSSKDGDETAAMWKRAITAESVSRSPRRSTSSHLPIFHIEQEEPSESEQPPKVLQPSVDGRSSKSDSQEHSPICHDPPTQEDEDVFRRSLVRSNTVLNEWALQMQAQEREAEAGANAQVVVPAANPVEETSQILPKSWCKFPSHNREERNEAAGEADSIRPRDFAVRKFSASGEISWTTDKEDAGEPTNRSIVRSFSDRFTHSVKSRLSKIVPGRSSTPYKDKSILGERRSSIQTSGNLEYPELELLPTAGGYSELQVLEREINQMKGFSDPSKRTSSDDVRSATNRLSLTEKMTKALQHDGQYDTELPKLSDDASVIVRRPSFVLVCSPATPASKIAGTDLPHGQNLSGSSGDKYATPLTHVSSCPDELSRPATPQSNVQPRPIPQPTNSANSSIVSVVRRASLNIPQTASDLAELVPGAWNGQDSIKRRSAPVSITPTLV